MVDVRNIDVAGMGFEQYCSVCEERFGIPIAIVVRPKDERSVERSNVFEKKHDVCDKTKSGTDEMVVGYEKNLNMMQDIYVENPGIGFEAAKVEFERRVDAVAEMELSGAGV